MPNPYWPATLPQFIRADSYEETPTDQTVETPMESGPVKIRRRCTADYPVIKCAIDVDVTQRAAFWDFWKTTLAGGSLKFDWVHPITRADTTFRFRKPVPSLKPVSGSKTQFRLAFSLEVQP